MILGKFFFFVALFFVMTLHLKQQYLGGGEKQNCFRSFFIILEEIVLKTKRNCFGFNNLV